MAVMDEFQKEREALRNGTTKEKLSYFWCYYKWHVIIAVSLIVIVTSFIHEAVTRKDTAFCAVLLNSWTDDETAEAFSNDFAQYAGIDTENSCAQMDSSLYIDITSDDQNTYASLQKMMVYVAAQDIDALVADASTYSYYAHSEHLTDLREILTPEQLEAYEPYFFYIDMQTARERQEAMENMDETYTEEYQDPSRPDEMAEPVPVGLFVSKSARLGSTYHFAEDAVAGMIVNTKRPEMAIKFLDYLMEQ